MPTFNLNRATYGGALAVYTPAIINASTVDGNVADSTGGAAHVAAPSRCSTAP